MNIFKRIPKPRLKIAKELYVLLAIFLALYGMAATAHAEIDSERAAFIGERLIPATGCGLGGLAAIRGRYKTGAFVCGASLGAGVSIGTALAEEEISQTEEGEQK